MLRYKEIKKMLIEKIGKMNPGDRLPSRPALCIELETTRTTLDRAIKELEKERIVSCQNGSGTYVVGLIDGAAPYVDNWCVIVPSIMGDIYPSLIQGIENIAQKYGTNIILCNSDNDADKQERYIRRLLVSGVSGFIIVPIISETIELSYRLYGTLLDSKIPFVFCNRGVEGIRAPLVKSNDFYGGYIATKHLLKKGYRRIAYMARPKYQTSVERCQGYISALLEEGIEIDRHLIVMSQQGDGETCFQLAKKLLQEVNAPDAFFCFNDNVAHDVCRAVQSCGLKISEEVGIIGYDNIASAASAVPPITSMAYKSVEIGEKAANILANRIKGIDPGSNFDYYLFQPSIVERESCLGPKDNSLVHKNKNI